jgi:membrane-associated phospholipid phosphatase
VSEAKPFTLESLGFEPPDKALIAYCAVAMAFVAWNRDAIPETPAVLTHHATAMFGVAAVARLLARLKAGPLVCAVARMVVFPAALILFLFPDIGVVVTRLSPRTYELELQAIDIAMFGVDPVVATQSWLSPLLADVLAVAYAGYFFLPFFGAGALVAKREWAWLNAVMTAVVVAGPLTWLGYVLVPARSPYVAATVPGLADAIRFDAPLPGGVVTAFVVGTLDRLDTVRFDAFPSGHVAVTFAWFLTLWKPARKAFWALLPFVLGLVASTILLRYHYVIDVIAGLALGAGVAAYASATRSSVFCTAKAGSEDPALQGENAT